MGINESKPLPYDENDAVSILRYSIKKQSIIFRIAIVGLTLGIVSFIITISLIIVNELRLSSTTSSSSSSL